MTLIEKLNTRNLVKLGHHNESEEAGQTFVETVFMLAFLLMLVFFISEVAVLWFVENSLNNAARVGARFAAVQPDLEDNIAVVQTKVSDIIQDNLDRSDAIIGITLTGDIVRVEVSVPFSTFFLNPLLGSTGGHARWNEIEQEWEDITTLTAIASMRYEL